MEDNKKFNWDRKTVITDNVRIDLYKDAYNFCQSHFKEDLNSMKGCLNKYNLFADYIIKKSK